MGIDRVNSGNCLKPFAGKTLLVPALFFITGLLMIPWSADIFHWAHHILRKLPLSSVFATTVQASSFTVIVGLVVLITILDRRKAGLLVYLFVGCL